MRASVRFAKTQHVDGSYDTGFNGFYGVVLVMNRGRRTCQMKNVIHLCKKGVDDVMSGELEISMGKQMTDVVLAA